MSYISNIKHPPQQHKPTTYHNPLFHSQSVPHYESTYSHYFSNTKLSQPQHQHQHPLKPNLSLYYYPPPPRETHNIDASQLTSMKHIDIDNLQDAFGRSLQLKKYKHIQIQNDIAKLYQENDDLKSIIADIKQAHLNKVRAHQIHERQTRRMKQLILDSELDEQVLQHLTRETHLDQQNEMKRKNQLLHTKYIIQQQLAERQHARDEAKKEQAKDKAELDMLINRVIEDDKRKLSEQQYKRILAKSFMDKAYAEKEEQKRRMKEEEELLKQRERKYYEDVSKREMEYAMKKKAIQDTKDKIFAQICADKARAQAEKDYYEDMKNHLHDEETARQLRVKEVEEKEKLQKQKEQMLIWARQQQQMKLQRKEEELRQEQSIMQKMLDKFKEDDKQEQLNVLKRKQKIIEYRNECERQWKLKREQYEQQRQYELQEREYQQQMENDKGKLIQQEKEKLIKDNEEILKQYYPKGYYRTLKKLEHKHNV